MPRPAQQLCPLPPGKQPRLSSVSGLAQSTLLVFGCPFRSSIVEMEATHCPEALQKLHERLCTETEPRKLYTTLKNLSSHPMCLEEIGFRQTIKVLRKQQLLVPYAKAFAAQWSEGCLIEPPSDPGLKDLAFLKNPMSEPRRDSPEDQPPESAFLEQGGDGRELVEVSSSSSWQSLN